MTAVARRERGFTLIEMLVSLAIMGMLATMLLGGLQTAGQFIGRTQQQSAAEEEIVTAQRLLRDRIVALRAVTNPNSATPLVDAEGDQGTFTFIGPPLARSEPDALWRYRITATATGDVLIYWASTLDDRYNFAARDTKGWRPITVLRNVSAMRISYFGADAAGSRRGWQTRWSQRPQPPDLVRIRISFRVGDRRSWPDLIVRPRATENSACRIDLLTGRCGAQS